MKATGIVRRIDDLGRVVNTSEGLRGFAAQPFVSTASIRKIYRGRC